MAVALGAFVAPAAAVSVQAGEAPGDAEEVPTDTEEVPAEADDDPGKRPEAIGTTILESDEGIRVGISGEIRIREEAKLGLFAPADPGGEESFDFAHMRTRLRFDVDVDEHLTAIVELQDVRTLGEEGSTAAVLSGVDLKRGEILLRNLLDGDLELEMGRYVMRYGDERLIGALEWVDQGRTYDGFRASFAPGDEFVDAFGVRVRDAAGPGLDQEMLGLYAGSRGWIPGGAVEGYALLFRDERPLPGESGTGDTRFVTVGTRLEGIVGPVDLTGELVGQFGELRGDDLAAIAFAVTGGVTFSRVTWTPRLHLEVDHASGDSDPTDGESRQFQTLFPTNHLHYGYADLVGWSNMWDLRAGVSLRPHEAVTVSGDWHHFRLADAAGGWINAGGATIRPGLPGGPSGLGDELDLLVRWRATGHLSVLGGWSRFLPGEFVEATGPSDDADFGYLQIRATF